MSKAEERLAAFLAKDEPPKRDWAFELEVEARLARARLARQGFETFCALGVAALLIWTLWPTLTSLVADLLGPFAAAWPYAVCAATLGFVFLVSRRRFTL